MFQLRVVAAALFVFLMLAGTLARAQAAAETEADRLESPERSGPLPAKVDVPETVRLVVERTNDFRNEHNLETLKRNDELHAAADYFADYMARTMTYGHTADGKHASERAEAHGYELCLVLENIAYYYSNRPLTADELAEQFVQGWIESKGHRRNMLDPDVIETGVAVGRSEKTGYYFAVQMFGRPNSAHFSFSIVNQTDQSVQYLVGSTRSDQRGKEKKYTLPPRTTMRHGRCRPPQVSFEWRDQPVEPEEGGRVVIEKNDQGQLMVAGSPAGESATNGPQSRKERP